MKSNYAPPKVIIKVCYRDIITASAPETKDGFDKNWLY